MVPSSPVVASRAVRRVGIGATEVHVSARLIAGQDGQMSITARRTPL